jgi:hypothetical protein
MDPYAEACDQLDRAGIKYLVVGAFGINLHAAQAGAVITTADCDLLLPADPDVLGGAVAALRALAYAIEAGDEPLPNEDAATLAGIVRARAVVRAYRGDSRIDLMLQMAGSGFDELWDVQRRFIVQGVVLRVAPLEALIRSKRLANRPKDQAFLAVHGAALEDLRRRESAQRPRRRGGK